MKFGRKTGAQDDNGAVTPGTKPDAPTTDDTAPTDVDAEM